MRVPKDFVRRCFVAYCNSCSYATYARACFGVLSLACHSVKTRAILELFFTFVVFEENDENELIHTSLQLHGNFIYIMARSKC